MENVHERMRNIYEELISSELEKYLNKYGKELMKISFQTLYNIFNHHKRKLNNHNLAYEHIVSYFNQTQDSNIFILLDLLDGHKLTRNNVEESYSLFSTRNNHMQKIDFSSIGELFTTQRKQSKLLEEQQQKYFELMTTINKQHELQEAEYKKSIEILENKIEQLVKSQQIQEQLVEEQQIKHSELLTTLNQQQKQQEVEYKKSIETLENKIEHLIKAQQEIKDNISNQYSEIISKLEQDKEDLNNQILEQNSKITKLEEELDNFKTKSILTMTNTQNNCQQFLTKLDKISPGILQQLKNNEKSQFDKLFIPSQSSNDIYNIINPNTSDHFSIPGIGKFIEIELQKTITIIGIRLFSASCYFLKSFDIEIDNVKVKNIMEAN